MRFSKPLHGLRGLASLMVFFAHITYGYFDHFHHVDVGPGTCVTYFANFGTFGVELFFIISGYVITQSCLKYQPWEFFGRRFLRLYPVFALFTVFYFVVNIATHQDLARGSVQNFLSNMLFLDLFLRTQPLTPNAWSITFEVWYYVAVYLLIYSFLHRAKRFSPMLAVASIGFAAFMVAAYDITAYFAGGAGLYFLNHRYGDRLPKEHRTLLIVGALAVTGTIATIWDFAPKTYFADTGPALPAFILLISTLMLVQLLLSDEQNPFSRVLAGRFFRFVGTISYSLYLLHPWVYLAMRQLGYKIRMGNYPIWETLPIYLVVITIVALGLSWIVHKLVEIGPYQLVYHRRIYQQPDTSES